VTATTTVRRLRLSPATETTVTAMRQALWPQEDADEIARETAGLLSRDDYAVFGAADGDRLVGMIEVGQRDVAESCTTSPVGYIEALWVAPDFRRRGVARALVAAAIGWSRQRGCRELASDAELGNTISQAMHAALGFTETERLVTFRMSLD
jgi:aminoglycoside 6'-N-acetyltransferase I